MIVVSFFQALIEVFKSAGCDILPSLKDPTKSLLEAEVARLQKKDFTDYDYLVFCVLGRH